jgi:hypothetical protein
LFQDWLESIDDSVSELRRIVQLESRRHPCIDGDFNGVELLLDSLCMYAHTQTSHVRTDASIHNGVRSRRIHSPWPYSLDRSPEFHPKEPEGCVLRESLSP